MSGIHNRRNFRYTDSVYIRLQYPRIQWVNLAGCSLAAHWLLIGDPLAAHWLDLNSARMFCELL